MPVDRWDRIRLSIAIQHTPARDGDPVYQRLVKELEVYNPAIVTDPAPGGIPSTWRTYAECLRSTPVFVTHRLVLQDDVEVCPNFVRGVEKAIKARPDNLLSFFISARPQESATLHLQAGDRGEAWSVLDARFFTPAQALCWPIFMIGPCLRYTEQHPIPAVTYHADDEMISRFLNARGIYALQSCPSLVEHAHHSATTLPQVNMPGPHRAAVCRLTHESGYDPAVDINWDSGAR